MIKKPTSCAGCPLREAPYGKEWGFSRPDGNGSNGVLIVAEALGESEEQEGVALVGKSGHFYFSELARIGLNREDFTIFNVIACRPPDNKLVKQPYEKAVIAHCAPNLDKVIEHARRVAKDSGKTFTILTLGKTAFKRIMGYEEKHPIMREDYLAYPHWNQQYEAWVVASDHPSYLVRGSSHLVPVMTFCAQRAVEIASNGVAPDTSVYLEDPPPHQFAAWVEDYLRVKAAQPEETFLSYDIETPYKLKHKNEDELAKEEGEDYTILRCSFAYRPGFAVSVPWTAPYLPGLEKLFSSGSQLVGWNSENFDLPRVAHQMRVKGDNIDGMLAWHVLNSSLDKGLGYVTPFYVHNATVWKHTSNERPAWYNCRDADYALQCFLGIRRDLKAANLWDDVFQRHVIETARVLAYMSEQGVVLDQEKRDEAEAIVGRLLEDVEGKIDASIPLEARQLQVYKKLPKSLDGLVEVPGVEKVTKCPRCGELRVRADHYKSIGKKRLKAGEEDNPCLGEKSIKVEVPATLWARPLEFKISKVSMERYQKVRGHRPIIDPKEKKVTFDEKAIERLSKIYPNDNLYPLIVEQRSQAKRLGTSIGRRQDDGSVKGGMPVGRDGKIHPLFTLNPSTLRSACQNPNLQNLERPNPNDPNDPANLIRGMIVASQGCTLGAVDFAGIEAVLVGWEARLKDYIRLALRDVHSYYSAYAIHELEPKRLSANDLPLLSWDDEKLFKRLGEIKKEFKADRNALYKHLVHAANFMQGPKGAAEKIFLETKVEYPVSKVGKVMEVYFELFPGIRKWHHETMAQADKDGHLRNAFGYLHRFSRVYEWEKVGGVWQKRPGPSANECIAFRPQSNAAGIIKEAMLRLYHERFEEAGRYLRLLIHDELWADIPDPLLERVLSVMMEEMSKPVKQLPLPASYGMGDYLSIMVEEKVGKSWGTMS